MSSLQNFVNDDSGAITVDFLSLTAAIVILGLVVGATISTGTTDLGNSVQGTLDDMGTGNGNGNGNGNDNGNGNSNGN